jgi:hypothetical protein
MNGKKRTIFLQLPLGIPFRAGIGEGPGKHFIITAFICPYAVAARTTYAVSICRTIAVVRDNTLFVAS